jgi:trimethylamine--corrinoid protein Co-methyltransferase
MPKLTVLTNNEVEAIHQASLRILAETGIILSNERGREILTGAGASIQDERVLIRPDLVEESIKACSPEVKLRGRDGVVRTLGDGSLHWHNLGGAPEIYDHHTGRRRPAVQQDVCDSTRLLDGLDGATTITPFFTPRDVPGALMSLAMYRNALPFTTKPLHGPGVQNVQEVTYMLEMAQVIGPPAEVLSLGVSPVSPLNFPDDCVEAILAIAEAGTPFGPLPCPTAGTTAPFSLAGALAQQNAEMLACIVLAELVHPGLPVIYSGRLAMMEPRTGISVWGGVELGLVSAATVQIGHRYGLPVNVYGLATNAHTLDIQTGYERGINAVLPALAGADELSGIGEMEAGVMGSYAQMVCDSEIAGGIRRLRKGFEVSAESLAVEVIGEVMHGSHNFLSQKHTRSYLRQGEMYYTHLADRQPWEVWENGGRLNMADRAQAVAERLLKEHQAVPLLPEQERFLDQVMNAAIKQLQE